MNPGRSITVGAVGGAVAVLGLLLLGACSHHIGDSCHTNVDCSPLGDRFCDIGSPEGYCTVDGCDYNTCPDNAVCVRFFVLQRGGPTCDPRRGTQSTCRIGELCLCEDAACKSAYCASETSERRWCMSPCSANGDCRDDGNIPASYSCYTTGANGAEPVPYIDTNGVTFNPAPPVQYCAPTPPAPL